MNLFNKDIFKKDIFSKEIFKKDKLKDGIKSLTNPLVSLANNAKTMLNYKEESKNRISDFIFIYPRIFWMTFPTKEKIKELGECLNLQFRKNYYYIWNVGEQRYDTSVFNNQVAEFSFVGYPCPPFQYTLLICKSILEWLNSDKDNVAIIHCQSTIGRSAIVISCLLSLLKVVNHPMEALTYFCNKLQINDDSFLLPSQKLCIRNFANLMDDIKLNDKAVVIDKIILSEVPKLTLGGKDGKKVHELDELRPYVQIFKGSKAIFNHLTKEKEPKVYALEDKNIEFEIGLEVTDDVLIRCRNFESNSDRSSIFRILFTPCLTFNDELKLFKRDIDFSSNVQVSDNFYIKIVLKIQEKENPEVDALNKLKAECLELAESYKNKKDKKEAPKVLKVETIEDVKNKFDIVDSNSKDDLEEKDEEKNENKPKESLTPNTDTKLKQFFNSIQQDDEDNKEEDDDVDLDEYISSLENKE